MTKTISCNHDSRTLLDFIKQEVIRNGINNLVIDYYFFDSIDDPNSLPSEQFSYRGLTEHYESIMQPYGFEFKFFMNREVQRVEFDSEKDECYIEIWV